MEYEHHGNNKAPAVAALAAWAVFFLFILLSGRINLYISPRFYALPVLGIVVLAAMVVTLVRNREHGLEHAHGAETWDWVPLFVMPIVVGFLVAPIGVGAVVAGNRQSDLLGGARQFGKLSLALGTGDTYKEVTVYELATAATLTPGKIRVQGQILGKMEGMAENRCPLAHYKMTCCVADLQPIAVVLEYPAGFTPQEHQWVSVRGTAWRDGDQTIVKADIITPSSAPNPPYLY